MTFIIIDVNAYIVHNSKHYANIKGDCVNDETIIVSVPYGTGKEELKNIREKYSGKNVVIFISGEEDTRDNLYKLLMARIKS